MAPVSGTSLAPRNRLLAALLPADLALLQPHLQFTTMTLLKDLERPNRRIETVYFLETGIASLSPSSPTRHA